MATAGAELCKAKGITIPAYQTQSRNFVAWYSCDAQFCEFLELWTWLFTEIYFCANEQTSHPHPKYLISQRSVGGPVFLSQA